jgi:hypothetical protein
MAFSHSSWWRAWSPDRPVLFWQKRAKSASSTKGSIPEHWSTSSWHTCASKTVTLGSERVGQTAAATLRLPAGVPQAAVDSCSLRCSGQDRHGSRRTIREGHETTIEGYVLPRRSMSGKWKNERYRPMSSVGPIGDGQPVPEFSWLTAHGQAASVETHGGHCFSRMPREFRLSIV